MNYKWIVCDMDGTLLNSETQIAEATKAKLLELQQKGTRVILASGRSYPRLEPQIQALKLREYGGKIISVNGVQIVDFEDAESIRLGMITSDLVTLLMAELDAWDFELQFNSDTRIEVYLTKAIRQLKRKIRAEMVLPNDYPWTSGSYSWFADYRAGYPDQRLLDDWQSAVLPCNKLTIVQEPESLASIRAHLDAAHLGEQFEMVLSDPRKLELTAKGVSKGNALQFLAMKYGVSGEGIIAFGDSENDLSLLEATPNFIAMANALPQVKAQAKAITLSNDDDGIKDYLDKYM